MFSLDYLPQLLPANTTLRGLFDSSLWLDLAAPDNKEVSLQEQTQGVLALVNASGRVSAACAAAYPGNETWRCLYGQYSLPFARTPYFMNQAQVREQLRVR